MNAPRILVVEDEPTVADVVERYLVREGYEVKTVGDGEAGLHLFRTLDPHLVVLDLMLPLLNGMEVCQEIRRTAATPVIMLTARGDEMDRVAGFALGADDYLAKPFSPRELVARVKAVLKRSFDPLAFRGGRRTLGEICLDANSRTVTLADEDVRLTNREFDLLWFLVTHPGRVYSREQLLELVWGFASTGDATTVTVHVRRLRTKVERDPERPEHLKTVWGSGYRWDA
jgi:DNA-binding response OmpR family regulator